MTAEPDILCLAARAAAAAEQTPDNIGQWLHAASLTLRAGDNGRAVDLARRAVALDSSDFRAMRALSGILGASGAQNEAIETGLVAIRLNPGDTEARLHVGGLLAAARRWREAAEHLAVHVVSAAARPAGWRLLSTALHQGGDTERAINAAREAIRTDPNAIEYRLHLVSLLSSLGRYEAGLEELAAAMAQAPENATVWRTVSAVRAALDDLPQALAAAERAIALDSGDASCQTQLNHVLSLCHLPPHRKPIGGARTISECAMRHADEDGSCARGGPERIVANARSAAEGGDVNAAAESGNAEAIDIYGIDANSEDTSFHEAAAAWTLSRAPGGPGRIRRVPPGKRPRPSLPSAAAERWRVIVAIMLREIRCRFGLSRMGYARVLVEPMSHLCTLGVVFYWLNHEPPPIGESLFLFYLTGLLPYLMFSHISHDVMNASNAQHMLLQLPIIKRTDVMVAQGLRQVATEYTVIIIIFSLAGLLGMQFAPSDALTAMTALALLSLLGLGVGAVNLVIAEARPIYETFYNTLIRLLYFASGIYYTPIRMPDRVRDCLVWNPVLQGIELFRAGFFHNYDPHWLDVPYLLEWVAGSLCIGFALERAARGRMEVRT